MQINFAMTDLHKGEQKKGEMVQLYYMKHLLESEYQGISFMALSERPQIQ